MPETAALVAAAQAGDAGAWDALVREFQDVAVALAISLVQTRDEALDVAQDAFLLAYEHLAALAEPRAFPGWFARLVRTAAARHRRRGSELLIGPDADVVEVEGSFLARAEALRVRVALEQLPEHERSVVALHYLGGLSYPAIAAYLDVSPAAVKKRAFSARRRLKETLAMTADALVAARPSRSHVISAPLALFVAIRRGDEEAVRALVEADPSLLHTVERWSPDDAMGLGLPNAEAGTPLVRAVATGNVSMTRLLLDAGAEASQRCQCLGAESALWTAVGLGYAEIADLLLIAGADADAAAFAGVTPLMLAAQRGNTALCERLVAAGADAELRDDTGRTAGDWSALTRQRVDRVERGGFLPTGVRAVDLFAPIVRGARTYWPPAWEVGASALLHEVVRALQPDEFWQVGVEVGPYDATSAEALLRQLGMTSLVRLTSRDLDPEAARADFFDALAQVSASRDAKAVLLLSSPDHHADVMMAAAELAADPAVLVTCVVEADLPMYLHLSPADHLPPRTAAMPEGFDAVIAFDPLRAQRGVWPALDPRSTRARQYPSARHEDLARRARLLLEDLQHGDPELDRNADTPGTELLRYLAQPFVGWEFRTGEPGQSTAMAETLDTVEQLLARCT
jgi:RNA polymerase sigma factor (sigma-70 family)